DAKPVGTDILRRIRRPDLAQVTQGHVMMLQAASWAVEDRQVLHGLGVPVLEAAVADAARLDLPAPANGFERVMRGPAALLQAIEGKRPLTRWDHVGKLFDLEIFRLLFQFHGTRGG